MNWHPGIGDPTVSGWIAAVLYLIASINCWRTAGAVCLEKQTRYSDVGLWRVISVAFLFLGINKQLDLQSALMEMGRVVSRSGGWYEQRRTLQAIFTVVAVVFCLAATPAIASRARKSPFQARLALVGSTFVLAYVIIRTASFNHFDRFISNRYLGFEWNWILEIAGIGMVLLASEWRRVNAQKGRTNRASS
ncbi:hypothetical protein JNB88_08735 [Rhizobium cauense]|uniref:hypothetical protein n=1 Tax=Rhizobium cauense TaxID=1166683 RepID=UPI001C6EAE6F|nr:hypothetical protein [Rhizobium cauense]MBW9113717.1 hypothetical protein [Rhizobium cauense]